MVTGAQPVAVPATNAAEGRADGVVGVATEMPLRWRDYFLLFGPLVIPYLVYRRGYLLLNSIGFVAYFGYAGLLTLNGRRLTREHLYFLLGLVLLATQLFLRTRSGLNSCLSLIAFVVVYNEIISRIGAAKAIKLMVIVYGVNVAFMSLELISQFGLFPEMIDPEAASWSIITPLQVGTSLYMQAQASALVAIAAMGGAIAGVRSARTARLRGLFLLAVAVTLVLAVINLRGTSLVSFLFATTIIAVVVFGKKGIFALGIFAAAVIAVVAVNLEAITRAVGFRFIDPETGFIDDVVVATYLELFLGVVYKWQASPLGDRLLGQRWSESMVGEFGFGNILYQEGLLALALYLTFVLHESWRAFRAPRHGRYSAVIYFNVFALVLYVASLTHYTNALNIGVANLMALHIAVNIALVRQPDATVRREA